MTREKSDYNAYMNEYMKRRYQKRRARAFEILGGVCAVCGSDQDLQIDHKIKEDKQFAFGAIWSGKLELFDKELQKAQLLCKEHHQVKTIAELSVKHGGGASGKKNCKCDLCRERKAEYMKKYKFKKKTRPLSSIV